MALLIPCYRAFPQLTEFLLAHHKLLHTRPLSFLPSSAFIYEPSFPLGPALQTMLAVLCQLCGLLQAAQERRPLRCNELSQKVFRAA